jgi:hypothetical protein
MQTPPVSATVSGSIDPDGTVIPTVTAPPGLPAARAAPGINAPSSGADIPSTLA